MSSDNGAAFFTPNRGNAVRNPVGTPVSQLDTPALVIDLDAMERNMATMKEYARKHNLLLRPHAKLHKSAALARLLMEEGGAIGVCVQKLGEAEAMAAGGVHDIFISNEIVHPAKLARVAALATALAAIPPEAKAIATEPRLTICCDCPEGVHLLVQALQERFATGAAMIPVGVFLEIDAGQGRCGAPPAGDRAVATVAAIAEHQKESPSLIFYAGIHAYNGASQHVRTYAGRKADIDKVVEYALATKAAVKEHVGLDTPLITGAGTGTFTLEAASGVFGELQPGSYLVMDRDYADNDRDPAHPDFAHALFVASRVMSLGSRTDGGVVVDAGHKSHAIDTGMPTVHGRPELEVLNRGDEHAIVAPREGTNAAVGLALNDLVLLIPGHCDPTFNLYDEVLGIRGGMAHGKVDRIISIDARGCAY